VLRINF